ncbi:MAG: hypothetical protein EPO21_01045 [Chloroflexota bacterium]|nr:MAG: hypothetical protein EPO21_01045 [Chloroflexota bacterium]
MTTATRSRIRARIASRSLATIAVALLAGVAVRLALLPAPGYDVEAYQTWARGVYEFGLTSAYRLDLDPWYNYPPGYLYALWITARLFVVLASQPDWSGPLLAALLKLPPILADVLTAGAIYLFLRGRVSRRCSLIASLAYLLNPAVIWNTAYWGGIDALHTLFLLLAVMAAATNRSQFSWPLVCGSVLIKPLGAPAALVVGAIALLRFDARRLLIGTLASLTVLLAAGLPFMWDGKLGEMLTALSNNVGNYPALSANAHNVWWLIAGGDVWRNDGTLALGPLSYRALGLVLFGLASLGVLSCLRRSSDVGTIFAAASVLQLNLFVWPTEVHENWSYAAFALLCVAAALRPSLRPFYLFLTLTFLTNLALQDLHLEPFWDSLNQAGQIDALRWANSLTYVVLAAVLVGAIWGGRRKGGARRGFALAMRRGTDCPRKRRNG